MKTLQRLCAVFVLTLTLSLSTFAGDMPTGITAPPPSPESQMTTRGDMTTGYMGDMSAGVTSTDPATEIVLSLLESLLSLF